MPKRPVIAAFLAAVTVFTYIHSTSTFGDADAFYHLQAAKETAASGPMRSFDALPLTTLADHFADHHFLYHVALIPFISAFGDPLGLKTATVLFGALAVAAFCFLLTDVGVRRPFLWTLPLLLAPGFVFRALLTKATSLALVAFFLFLAVLRRGSRPAAFVIAFAYVWLHGGWPLLFIASAIDAAMHRSMRLLPATAAGLIAGLVINPFFPHNVWFYWEQTVQIAVVGGKAFGVYVGNEWHPAYMHEMILNNALLFLPVFAAVGLLAWRVWRRASAPSLPAERRRLMASAWILALVLMLMTVRQARHKEYALPVLVLAAVLLWDALGGDAAAAAAYARARAKLGRLSFYASALAVAAFMAFVGHEIWYARDIFTRAQPYSRFEGAGAWMHAEVPPGEIVFHTAWDEFPLLYYRAPELGYIAGLDPRFFHRKDPALYWRWRDISDGRVRAGLADAITEGFGARYVFLERKEEPMLPLVEKDPSFERVYQDAEAEVWRISP